MTKSEKDPGPSFVMADGSEERGMTLIYNDITRDARITLQARGLYLILLSYVGDENVDTGRERMARDAGVSTRQLSTIMDELKACGLVIVKMRGRNVTNQYRLTDRVTMPGGEA